MNYKMKKPKDVSKQVESSLYQFLHCKDECEFCGYHDESKVETQQSMPECCGSQNLRNMECQITCVACGQVVGEEYKTEYINFHANLFKIYKKTVYNRLELRDSQNLAKLGLGGKPSLLVL